MGSVENSDYYDIAEIKAKHSKRRGGKRDAGKQNYSRVPALNQTEYFLTKQDPASHGSHVQNKPLSTRNHKHIPVSAAESHQPMMSEPDFLVFDRTSDNANGAIFHHGKTPIAVN